MKSLLQLHISVIRDMGDLLGVDPTRDIQTLESRFTTEGDSFLTITLPTFEEGFLASLESGRIAPSSFRSFRFRGCLPLFLRGFTSLVFGSDGMLLSNASSDAVFALRQITSFSKKLERRVSPALERAAERQFVSTDKEVLDVLPHEAGILRSWFEYLFRDVCTSLDSLIANFQLVPRHGPGAVAERRSAAQKWEFLDWLESLEEVFPSSLYTHHDGRKAPLPCVSLDEEPPVRVSFVPKTMRGPRVIAIEPYARQFAQQAIARHLYEQLRNEFPSGLDLFDQKTNQAWAWLGSIDGSVATLDLSEASDRLSHSLVAFLFSRWPHLSDALSACRSSRAELPSGDIVTLKKFASMGSALTFPIQSMVFFAISCMGTFGHNIPKGVKRALKSSSCISVFGDDIVVPTDARPSVGALLESFGLKVNIKKSYDRGNFRESCGGDYFRGKDVTIVRLRQDVPSSKKDAEGVSSMVALRNHLYVHGLWRTASECDRILSELIRWLPAPVGHPSLSRWTYLPVEADYDHEQYQTPFIRRPKLIPVGRPYRPDGLSGLFKWFLESLSSAYGKSLFEPSERPTAFAIYSRGWRLHM